LAFCTVALGNSARAGVDAGRRGPRESVLPSTRRMANNAETLGAPPPPGGWPGGGARGGSAAGARSGLPMFGSQSALSDLADVATADMEDQGWAAIKRAQPLIEQWVGAPAASPPPAAGVARSGAAVQSHLTRARLPAGGSVIRQGPGHLEAGPVEGRSVAV